MKKSGRPKGAAMKSIVKVIIIAVLFVLCVGVIGWITLQFEPTPFNRYFNSVEAKP